ncbi:MAG: AAA family ATPase [Lawsonibacter sp.]
MVQQLGLASVIVAHAGLGTINSVVLTAEYMRARNLAVKGILFNHFHPGDRMEEDNVAMCQERTGLPVLALVQDDMERFPMDGQALAQLYDEVK